MTDNVDLSIRQFIEAWQIFCAPAPGYSTHREPGAEYIFSGVNLAFFNTVVLTGKQSADSLADHALRAREWAADKTVPWILITTDELLDPATNAAVSLDACGFGPLMPLTGMVARHVNPLRHVPPGLELRVAADDAGCEALLNVNAAGYGIDFDAGKPVWGRHTFWQNHFVVLGFAEEQAASGTAVMMTEGHRHVALVATDPRWQRRGFADAAMRRALELARDAHGDRPTFLHASEAGRPVYERMGYEYTSRHMIYMDKKFLQ